MEKEHGGRCATGGMTSSKLMHRRQKLLMDGVKLVLEEVQKHMAEVSST